MQIQVFQGEREIASANTLLGSFELGGIAPAPRGVPQIEVTFDIDANGIVSVSAKDKGTGKENTITIQDGSKLSQEDIDRMIKDAEAHADEDRKRREEQETRNNAETMAYQTRKFMDENTDKLPEDLKTRVSAAADEVDEALKGDDLEAIKSAVEKLTTESQELGKALYEAEANSGATQADVPADDNVVDAEVVEDDAEETGTTGDSDNK